MKKGGDINAYGRKKKHYTYKGPVWRFEDIVKREWFGSTHAVSPAQALNQLTYRCKLNLGVMSDTRIKLNMKYLKEVG